MKERAIARLLAPIGRRLNNLVARATVLRADDTTGVQTVQLRILAGGDVLDGVGRLQDYGDSGVPPAGAEAVVLSRGGHRQAPLVVVVDHRASRPGGLEPGETVRYSVHGQRLWYRADGSAELETAPGARIRIDAGGAIDVTPAPGQALRLGPEGDSRPVARVGDRVSVGNGSSAGLWPIVEGSDHVESA